MAKPAELTSNYARTFSVTKRGKKILLIHWLPGHFSSEIEFGERNLTLWQEIDWVQDESDGKDNEGIAGSAFGRIEAGPRPRQIAEDIAGALSGPQSSRQ